MAAGAATGPVPRPTAIRGRTSKKGLPHRDGGPSIIFGFCKLAQFRVVHFATHGALAGQIGGIASAEDDGYLAASEIAGLRPDADWVILSACNTAAGASEGSETLSGLSRAFIYAQARALLVSHWSVESHAAIGLITSAIGEMSRDAGVGRAEALRRAMLALIDRGETCEAHPSYWAPFVVVGEGGR
jgi:CHAT domain-containing protein